MPLYQIKCETILVVEADDSFEAVHKFIADEQKGGFHYTVKEIIQEGDKEYGRDV